MIVSLRISTTGHAITVNVTICQICGGVDSVPVPGNHVQLFASAVPE